MPKYDTPENHIRDIEAVTPFHLPLLQKLDKVKWHLLEKHCPDVSERKIHAGYHRGRRPMFGTRYYWPDIISVHHLHLHVIVEPRWWMRWFKYPNWLGLMWKSDEALLKDIRMKTPDLYFNARPGS